LAGDCAGGAVYANRAVAETSADEYRRLGFDVDLKPLAAQLHLGGGAQVLSTFAAWPDHDLAYQMLYELGAQAAAPSNDMEFVSALADVFARAGAQRWVARNAPARLATYVELETRRAELLDRLARRRDELSDVLSTGASPAGRRARKEQILHAMQALLQAQPREVVGGRMGLDRLELQPMNNAHVAGLTLPGFWQRRFEETLQRLGGDPQRLLAVAREIAKLPSADRLAALRAGKLAAR
jgi:predicted aminopeptidase